MKKLGKNILYHFMRLCVISYVSDVIYKLRFDLVVAYCDIRLRVTNF